MLVKELFEEANKNESNDLQALIMFLVFEKQVLKMDADTSEMDIYFSDKHNKRMNRELASYKKKMNMGYKPYVYEVQSGRKLDYIYAKSLKQAEYIANKRLLKPDRIRICDMAELMNYEGKDMTLKTITENKKAPLYLGGF